MSRTKEHDRAPEREETRLERRKLGKEAIVGLAVIAVLALAFGGAVAYRWLRWRSQEQIAANSATNMNSAAKTDAAREPSGKQLFESAANAPGRADDRYKDVKCTQSPSRAATTQQPTVVTPANSANTALGATAPATSPTQPAAGVVQGAPPSGRQRIPSSTAAITAPPTPRTADPTPRYAANYGAGAGATSPVPMANDPLPPPAPMPDLSGYRQMSSPPGRYDGSVGGNGRGAANPFATNSPESAPADASGMAGFAMAGSTSDPAVAGASSADGTNPSARDWRNGPRGNTYHGAASAGATDPSTGRAPLVEGGYGTYGRASVDGGRLSDRGQSTAVERAPRGRPMADDRTVSNPYAYSSGSDYGSTPSDSLDDRRDFGSSYSAGLRRNGRSDMLSGASTTRVSDVGRRADGSYEVQPNESYWQISEKLYGTGAYFRALAECNRRRIPREDELQVGDVISAPALAELEKTYPDLCPKPSRRAILQSPLRTVSTSTRLGGRTYVSQEGDTLSEIARVELGKSSRWVEIYDMNRDVIGPDYHYLRPGLTLQLPDNGSAEAVARRVDATAPQPR